jgi:hypothetical protein
VSEQRNQSTAAIRWVLLTLLVFGTVFGVMRDQDRGAPPPPGKRTSAPTFTDTNSVNVELAFPLDDQGRNQFGFDRIGGFPLELTVLTNEQGFLYHDPTPLTNQLPAEILALDRQRIVIDGFMQPTRLDGAGKISEFLLMRDRSTCCFGGTPEVHHWMPVTTPNGLSWAKLGSPVRVSGVMTIAEIKSEGVVYGIYSLAADEVEKIDKGPGVTE